MQYVYVRVSTKDQNTISQKVELSKQYPNAKIIEETASTRKERPRLQALIDHLIEGDTLIVWKLDRISRSMIELQKICSDLHERGITLISTTQNVDMSTPMGKMFVAVLGMVAEMERENISERTKIGIAARKERFKYSDEPWRKTTTHSKGGRTCRQHSDQMLKRLCELKEVGLSWRRVVEKLAYENPKWKIGSTTAARIHGRILAKKLLIAN